MVKLAEITTENEFRKYDFDSPICNGGPTNDFSPEKKQEIMNFAAEKQYTYDDKTKSLKAGDQYIATFHKCGFKILKAIDAAIAPAITKLLYGDSTNLEYLLKSNAETVVRKQLVYDIHDYQDNFRKGKTEGLKEKITEAYKTLENVKPYLGQDFIPKYEVLKKEYDVLLANVD